MLCLIAIFLLGSMMISPFVFFSRTLKRVELPIPHPVAANVCPCPCPIMGVVGVFLNDCSDTPYLVLMKWTPCSLVLPMVAASVAGHPYDLALSIAMLTGKRSKHAFASLSPSAVSYRVRWASSQLMMSDAIRSLALLLGLAPHCPS